MPINDEWIFACSGEQGDPRMLTSCCWLIAVVLAGLEPPPDKHFYQDGTITEGEEYMMVLVHDTLPDHTSLTMLGGDVLFAMVVWDGGTANILGGSVGALCPQDDSRFQITGGQVLELYSHDRSSGLIETGSMWSVSVDDASSVCIRGNVTLLHAGILDTAQLSFYDGVVVPDGQDCGVYASGGHTSVYGGVIAAPITATGSSVIDLWGGNLTGTLRALDDSRIRLYGSGFEYDPQGGRLGQGSITGLWLDGIPFSLSLDQSESDTISHISFLPEPQPCLLFLLALQAFLRRRVKQAAS